MVLGPLLLSLWYPESFALSPLRWLRSHLSEGAFLFAYVLIQGSVVAFLTYAMNVHDYLHPNLERRAAPQGGQVDEGGRPRGSKSSENP